MVVCFLGHREIEKSEDLAKRVRETVKKLIIDENVTQFLFGSKSDFNGLCYKVVSEVQKKYPYIKRIYVRAEFEEIDEDYKDYLLQRYEDTYYPKSVINAGRAVYVKRNYEMINKSNFCVVYYNAEYNPVRRKSGTEIAIKYAKTKGKTIINVFE